MYCRKCGNELKEDDLFCNKCGNKIISEKEINTNNITEQVTSEEYKSKLARANNAANLFLKEEKHTLLGYNQVCALYGEVEKIGTHIPKTFIDELDFFVKANLLDDGMFFNTVEKFEKVFDNLMQLALANIKTDNEKEDLKKKYTKTTIMDEFEKKLNTKKEKQKQANKPLKILFIVLICIIILPILIAINNNSGTTNNNNSNSTITSDKNDIKYGSSKYENSIYGEKVVKAYYNNYGITSDVGEIKSITKSEFLEKDNYGRYAFKVTFKYYPKNKAHTATLYNMASDKTVIAIYVLNLDDPDGLYVGIQNIKEMYYSTWEDIKNYDNVCGGAWNTPVTLNFTN